MNAATFVAWLKLFIAVVKPSADKPVLLIVDNHSTRFDLEALGLALENHVHILVLPPNLTWLLQPADLAVFGPFKTYLTEVATSFVLGGGLIVKSNLVGLLSEAWIKAVSVANIQKGFLKSGIWPFNPSVIPDSVFALAGSGQKSAAVAAMAQSKQIADCKARLLALPVEVQGGALVAAGSRGEQEAQTPRRHHSRSDRHC